MVLLRRLELPLFFILFASLLWFLKPSHNESRIFNGDDLRYISYAVSMHEHGVFGLLEENINEAPPPGNANAPLYPVLIAGVMAIDSQFAGSLICIADKGHKAGCAENFQSFFIVQVALGVLCLFLIYLTALALSKNRNVAWLAAILALGSGILTEFSYIFMTEILILPVFSMLMLACLSLYQKKKLHMVFAIAVALAILTLIRPSYLYLFYGFVLFFGGAVLLKRDRLSLLRLGILIAGFMITISPWALRNKIHFDSFTLTTGGYAEAVLIQRTNYNQMSWSEIGVAMIYWLPDFGDSLAENIFPEKLYNKLGWDKKSYYAQGYGEKVKELTKQLGDKDQILEHLIKTDILTFKNIAVSVPLALRGVFIAKYWGLAGFIAFIALLINTLRQRDYSILMISLPLFFVVAFHAGLSVSIPRYNLPLITLYALSMAWYINLYGIKIFKKFCNE